MQYRQGSIGRIIVAKVEHGDDLLAEINKLLEIENVQSAVMFMIGALENCSLVVGPEKCSVPPQPVWRKLENGHEILGIATVFSEAGKPVIHLHASLGRGDEPITGCIRKDSKVYLVVEIVLIEILGSEAVRSIDAITGLNLLGFS
ncbi:MAG: DNA-binding protein [Syntrophomonadaceae bacterium]|nr:DNA-binding protein [Syntrophomonadaceae bacterium]MDD3023006.1 DNA-binding protein [Syntrophomonadaceae bacterium]